MSSSKGLPKNLCWFLDFLDTYFSDGLLQLPFSQRLRWKHSGEIIIIGDNYQTTVEHSPTLFQNDLVQTPIDFCEQAKHIRGPKIGFYKVRKLCRTWNNRPIEINSSTNDQWGDKEGRHQVIWQRTPIHRISPICFHPNRWESGKDNSSSEAHLKGTQAWNFFFYFFCRNRILMVPRACNTRFLKIVFDSAEIFDF
jgi:hypothetical protein